MPLGLVQRHCLLLRRPVAIVPSLEDVLVPCSICIFALNGIFCIDRRGKAKQSHSKIKKKTKPFECASLCIACLSLQPFDLLTSLVCVSLSSGLWAEGEAASGRKIVCSLRKHCIRQSTPEPNIFALLVSSLLPNAHCTNGQASLSVFFFSMSCTHLH